MKNVFYVYAVHVISLKFVHYRVNYVCLKQVKNVKLNIVKNVKSFPSLTDHRAVLISVS